MKNNKKKTKETIKLKQLLSLILVAATIVLIEYIMPKLDETQENHIVEVSTQNENIKIEDIPEYSNQIVISINNDIPYFEEKDLSTEDFEYYSNLDELGRGGQAFANICKFTMPKERCKKGKLVL